MAPEDVRRFYGTAMFGEDSWGVINIKDDRYKMQDGC